MNNLQSSVNEMGKSVTQIFHFAGDVKRTFRGLLTESIKDGEFTKIKDKSGRMLLINKRNLLMVEVFEEGKEYDPGVTTNKRY